MTDVSGRQWAEDGNDEDEAVEQAEQEADSRRWVERFQARALTEQVEATAFDLGAGPMALVPDDTDRQTLTRTETIDGLPVMDWLAEHPDERDPALVCAACLTVPPKKHRYWRGRHVLCGACHRGRELFTGAGEQLDRWLSAEPWDRRRMIIAEHRIDPVTGQRARWHGVDTMLDDEGLHDSYVGRFLQTGRPFGYWDLVKTGQVELRSP